MRLSAFALSLWKGHKVSLANTAVQKKKPIILGWLIIMRVFFYSDFDFRKFNFISVLIIIWIEIDCWQAGLLNSFECLYIVYKLFYS